jgi:hypothetical protein
MNLASSVEGKSLVGEPAKFNPNYPKLVSGFLSFIIAARLDKNLRSAVARGLRITSGSRRLRDD